MGANVLGVVTGVGRTAAGIIQGQQNAKANAKQLADAYRRGKERLAVAHADERQSGAERLVARGLSQGGGVNASARGVARVAVPRPTTVGGVGSAVNPGGGYAAPITGTPVTTASAYRAGGPTNLGAQDVATRAGEQQLENTDLTTTYYNDLANNQRAQESSVYGAVADGISTGFGLQGRISAYQAAKDPRDTAPSTPAPRTMDNSSLTASAFGGINPVNPLKGGAWGTTVDDFNVVGGRRRA